MFLPLLLLGGVAFWLMREQDKSEPELDELDAEGRRRRRRRRQLELDLGPRTATVNGLTIIEGAILAEPELAGPLRGTPVVEPLLGTEVPGIGRLGVVCIQPELDPPPTHHAPWQCGEFRTVRVGNRIENRRAYPGQLCNEPQLALAVRDMNLAEEPIELYRQLVSLKCVDGIWTDTGVLCWEDGARAVNPWGQTVARCRDGVWGPP